MLENVYFILNLIKTRLLLSTPRTTVVNSSHVKMAYLGTLTDYSHELAALVDRLESAGPQHVVNRDYMLRGATLPLGIKKED